MPAQREIIQAIHRNMSRSWEVQKADDNGVALRAVDVTIDGVPYHAVFIMNMVTGEWCDDVCLPVC